MLATLTSCPIIASSTRELLVGRERPAELLHQFLVRCRRPAVSSRMTSFMRSATLSGPAHRFQDVRPSGVGP